MGCDQFVRHLLLSPRGPPQATPCTPHWSLYRCWPPRNIQNPSLVAPITSQVQQACKCAPATLMFFFLGWNLHVGSWVTGKNEGQGEQGRKQTQNKLFGIFGSFALFEQPLCLDRLQELRNFQHLLHIKELLEELSKLWGWAALCLPTLILNQAFICLPIGTDAKCPWHTHPPNNLNLIWGFRPSWLKKIAYDLLGSHPPQHRQLWADMLMFVKEQLPWQHRVQRKGPPWYQNRGEW